MSVDTLEPQHVGTLNSKTCFLVFEGADDGQGPTARKSAEAVAAALPTAFTYFYAADDLAGRVREFVGLSDPATTIAVISVPQRKNYVFKGDKADADAVVAWAKDVEAGKAPLFVKSGPRPENDRDPEHPEVYKLTADSFDELVTSSQNEFLVDLWADWCGPCLMVAPTLNLLAEVFADVPSINVGKLNVDENDTNRELFPETHIPNMKFFSNKDKKSPIKYGGNRSLAHFVEFIHENAATEFDLAEYKQKASKLAALDGVRSKLQKQLKEATELSTEFGGSIESSLLASLTAAIETGQQEVAKAGAASPDDITAATEAIKGSEAMAKLKEAEKAKKIEDEKKALKNVIKVHSDDEYDAEIASAGDKAVIVDCFATWCGPCVYISPIYNDLSEKYPGLKFLKIDVDEQRRTAQALKIRAMPTFKVIKNGEVVDELVGADPGGLEKLCQKYSS